MSDLKPTSKTPSLKSLQSTSFIIIIILLRVHLLVFEVDFLGSDATPASLQLPCSLLQDAQFFISERGRRAYKFLVTLHGVRALEGVVVHHLVLVLCSKIEQRSVKNQGCLSLYLFLAIFITELVLKAG